MIAPAKHLHVCVERDGVVTASIQLPARAVMGLSFLIDGETAKKIEAEGYDVDEIAKSVIASGFAPQVIINTEVSGKKIRVWLA